MNASAENQLRATHLQRTLAASVAALIVYADGGSAVAQQTTPIEISATVSTVPPNNEVAAGTGIATVEVDLYLDTDSGLLGLSIRVHFDAQALTLLALDDMLPQGMVAYQIRTDDRDLDGDQATDAYINVAWMDGSQQWPGVTAGQYHLLRARFSRTGDSETVLRIVGAEVPPGRSLKSSLVRVGS